MQRLVYPFPLFLDQRGDLLDAGKVYVGVADDDPESAPLTVYWDPQGTVPALQPLETRGGLIVNNGRPAVVYVPDGDYSQRVKDANGNLIAYSASANATLGTSYQPHAAVLDALSLLTTTDYGNGILTVSNAAAARAYLGIVASLALTGGTVSGNIARASAGPHLYHTDGTFISGRVFVTASGAADPTSQDGDVWIETSP